jgi:hypothetical protein
MSGSEQHAALQVAGIDMATGPDVAVYDLSASGGPDRITAQELAEIAAVAKAKVKATARGWSMLSQVEILALAFIADVVLEDGALPEPAPAKPAPNVISHV